MTGRLSALWFRCRAALMLLIIALLLIIFVPTMLLTGFLPLSIRSRWSMIWMGTIVFALRWVVNIRLQFEGMEALPERSYILYSKHNSALETFIIQHMIHNVCWIAKKEAFYVPFFGWGLAVLQPIWIDRSDGGTAIEQILRKGSQKLAKGQVISIFPEGTRVPVGKRRPFKAGGALLAEATGADLVCMTHNCGCFWPARKLLFTRPGVITFRFRQPVSTEGRTAKQITADARDWIDRETEQLYRSVGC